jgi:hypothetical protein
MVQRLELLRLVLLCMMQRVAQRVELQRMVISHYCSN